MRKIICLLTVVCFLLSCLSACGKSAKSAAEQSANKKEQLATQEDVPLFENKDAMLKHLNGIWVVENKAESQEYYIFQNGELFYINDTAFLSRITEYLEATQAGNGDEALLNTTFEEAVTAITGSSQPGEHLKADSFDCKYGLITFDTSADGSSCKKISVDKSSATFTDSQGCTFPLTQLSADCSFQQAHFEDIFNAAKKPYQDIIEAQTQKKQLHAEKLYGVLDYSKVWGAVWNHAGSQYDVCFGFTKGGKCYYLLSIGFDVLAAGKGTYTVNDDGTILMKIRSGGKNYADTYSFDTANKALTLLNKGMLGNPGNTFKLKKNSDITFNDLKDFGNLWVDSFPSHDY